MGVLGIILFFGGFVLPRWVFSFGRRVFVRFAKCPNWHYEIVLLVKIRLELAALLLRFNGLVAFGRLCSWVS